MSISDAQYQAWLESDDAYRCVLVEPVANVSSVETTFYLSNMPYANGSVLYDALLVGGSVKTSEAMSLDSGEAEYTLGMIQVANFDGELDAWFDYVWANRSITVYFGDVRWPKSDFRTFAGTIRDIQPVDRLTLGFVMRDKMERLNYPITETKLGGSTNNKDELVPLAFGEPHNIRPLQTNPATLEYQVHGGAIERFTEVRDNEVPVSITGNTSTGKFILSASPAGIVTASIQGDKYSGTYITKAADIVTALTTRYGQSTNRFTSGDLDTASLATFNTANPQPLGLYIDSNMTVREAVKDVAASVGAQPVLTRQNKLKLLKLDVPSSGEVMAITEDDIVEGSLRMTQKLPVQTSFKIGYARNWQVQEPVDARVTPAAKDLFAKEWLTYTATDSTAKALYRQMEEPEQIDTYLIRETDAQTLANFYLALFGTIRQVWEFSAKPKVMSLNLGDTVTIAADHINGGAVTYGMVVRLDIGWVDREITVGVLI
ncbi:MAG: hypothetical protein IPI17_17970 [Nitrosomonas sp.]|nr:hypothetical protein [Nitrosomonas sp.]